MAAEREFDVVVFGATGVTGRRVAAYLAEQAAEHGRPGRRRRAMPGSWSGCWPRTASAAPETIVADVGDPASLAAMASRARVVLNLVGPYTLYGQPVIEACVADGAHYVDLTGEIPFVRQMIDAYDARARHAGVKVVQVCGFEALPPDLAVLLAAETARERWGEGLAEADLEVSVEGPPGMPRPSDMISGGTFQSLAAAAGGDDASAVTDPAALITDPAVAGEVRRRSPITVAPRRSGDAVIAPMAPAAFINPAVIQRTAALGGSGAVPLPRGPGAAGSGRHASASLRGGGRAFRDAGGHGGSRACAAVGAASRGPGAERDPSLVGLRAGRGSPRGVEVAHVGRGPHDRRARRCGSTSTPTATRVISRPRGCWARPGCCWPSRGDAGAVGVPDAGDRARHGVRGPLRAGAAAVLRQPPEFPAAPASFPVSVAT